VTYCNSRDPTISQFPEQFPVGKPQMRIRSHLIKFSSHIKSLNTYRVFCRSFLLTFSFPFYFIMIVDGPIGARGHVQSVFLLNTLLIVYKRCPPHLVNGTLKFTHTFMLDLSFFHKLFKFLKYPAHKGCSYSR